MQCSDCQGLWFRDGKFREVKRIGFSRLPGAESLQIDSENTLSSDEEAQETLTCPDCQEYQLIPYTYAYSTDIQLHRCGQCQGIWANSADLIHIDKLLSGYQESLEEAKARVLPLILKMKKQIQQEEREKEEEQKRAKKGVFQRFFGGSKRVKNRKVQDIFNEETDNEEEEHI